MTERLPARIPGARFVGLVSVAPAALALSRLLPAEGIGLALRLAAAAVCVLLIPGALVLRTLGWPDSLALAAAGSLALSLVVVSLGLALVFAAQASLTLALVVIIIVSLSALVPAAVAPAAPVERSDLLAMAAVAVAGILFGSLVWWSSRTLGADAIFHAARARKLDGLPALSSVSSVDEFRDGGLHPGYAFPLWHGVLALVSRLAAVDVAVTVLRLAAVLVPAAFVLAYAAGRELFRSWAGGVATVAAQLALFGLGRNIPASFEFLSLPKTALLLPPTVLALAFAYVNEGKRTLLVPLAGGALALALVHPTSAVFVALVFAGFLVARLVLAKDDWEARRRFGVGLAAVTIPPALFFLWLLPAVRASASVTPSAAREARDLANYKGFFEGSGHFLHFSPEAISRSGPAVVAALLLVPLAVLATRRLWAAYVLGGTLTGLAVLLLPFVFSTFADVVSLSQARRLPAFMPLSFALAGAAILASQLRLVGLALAVGLAAGIGLAYPGEFTYHIRESGPGWPVLVAIGGGAGALVVGARLRRLGPVPGAWAALVALAFALTIGISGIGDLQRQPRDSDALTPGLIEALRAGVKPGDVLFGDVDAIYRAAAYVPAYIAAAPPAHVALNVKNRPRQRLADVRRFFAPATPAAARRRLLDQYAARWLLVDKSLEKEGSYLTGLQRVFDDRRYALYRVRA